MKHLDILNIKSEWVEFNAPPDTIEHKECKDTADW